MLYSDDMVRLSVNVNKVATLRNARGGDVPNLVHAVHSCIEAGAPGITVHPREDQRHITQADLRNVAAALEPLRDSLEFNIEGDPRDALIEEAVALKPHQFTLVPVIPGEITSQAGWRPGLDDTALYSAIEKLKQAGIRISLFLEADESAIRWAATLGVQRIELYTEPYAQAAALGANEAARSFARYSQAATLAHSLGLQINAGHDLDLNNLKLFATLPHLAEVSIGHALISQALFDGLKPTVKRYLDLLHRATRPKS